MESTTTFDLAIAWTWEFDAEFVRIVRQKAEERGVKVVEITRANIVDVWKSIESGSLRFRWLLDRASDEDERFLPLVRAIDEGRFDGMRMFNRKSLLPAAADKATMHLEFLSHEIPVPYTIIFSPYSQEQEVSLSLSELSRLGRSFIIKPANTTGGGTGVVVGAESLKEVIEARKGHPNDKYLLQETIRPGYVGDNRGWFRVFMAFGAVCCCWWDDQTHVYEEVTQEDERMFSLGPLREIMGRIRSVCRLDFFSSELVLTRNGTFVAVDYVNEICDMRLQSKHPDGVADRVVESIAGCLVQAAASGTISLSPNIPSA